MEHIDLTIKVRHGVASAVVKSEKAFSGKELQEFLEAVARTVKHGLDFGPENSVTQELITVLKVE